MIECSGQYVVVWPDGAGWWILTSGFCVERPFGWGLMLVGDAASQDLPGIDPDTLVTATESSLAVCVRHAQDVDLDSAVRECHVRVEVRVNQHPDQTACFDGVINVPSGRITFGDADGVEELQVMPGHWRVQVAAEPEDHPEHVYIWITSAD